MWIILEFIVLAAIVLISITEFFYPLFTGKPFFGSFRSKPEPQVELNEESEDASLKEKISLAKEKIKEVKGIQKEVNKNYKSAEQLKREADDLLNNSEN